MEELTSILGLVVAAGLLLAKSAIRTRAAKAAKEAGNTVPESEAWPTWSSEPADRPQGGEAGGSSVFEPIAQQVPAARNTDRSRSPKKEPARAARVRPATATNTASPRATTNAATGAAVAPEKASRSKTGGTTERFDLRRAVIASEILRPKFDE